MNILLVEDDVDALKTLRKGLVLSFPTFTIETASSAEDAEQRIGEGPAPDLVITDVRLPGRSGVDLLVGLQARFPELRFILTSGYPLPKLPKDADGDCLLRFLEKPFELSQLVAEVQNAFMRDQFSDRHRSITFIDILQVLNMSRRTALVQLFGGGDTAGEIYLFEGEVHHAVCGELEGTVAFRRLCQAPETAFRVRRQQPPPRRTIRRSFGTLLIDVMSED